MKMQWNMIMITKLENSKLSWKNEEQNGNEMKYNYDHTKKRKGKLFLWIFIDTSIK